MKSHHAKLLQSYLTVCFPVDHSLPGSSVHGILQVRTLEWVTHALLQGISTLHTGQREWMELRDTEGARC